MIRTVFFDMGNVLVDFSHDRMCRQIGELCGLDGPALRSRLIDSGLQWEFERGRVSEEDFCHTLGETVGRAFAPAALREAGSDIFSLKPGIVPILNAVKRSGRRMVLLSNTSVAHFEWIWEKFDVLQRFDDHVVSFRVGAIKPEPAIYEAALQAAGCAPAECFYTDDIPAYVEEGRRVGWQAEVFTTPEVLSGHLARHGIAV